MVVETARCCFCQKEAELVLHVLWSCGAAQDVWAGSLAGHRSHGEAFIRGMEPVLGYLLADMALEEHGHA
ncbi:hypothetical protein SO802_027048 [Lithocarpus litseifolius]|uniref:Reverse transcriptase zinc-binding domain-containing protein n=1 Tax=Lithocarpus litseifolius TaxID=425828 RepID=A0AAW2C2A1_9ROSI